MRRYLKPLLIGLTIVSGVACAGLIWFVQQNVFLGGFLPGDGTQADVEVPAGFAVNVFASGLTDPRFMTVGPDGTLFVAERRGDRIVALPDTDQDGRADQIVTFAADLGRPHSVVFREDAWYVGVPTGVIRLVDADNDLQAETRETLEAGIDGSGTHSTRTPLFLRDGRLVLSVGSTCNACFEEDPLRATILIYDGAIGVNERVYASGLRNAVGLALNPATGDLWATNNGRDLMGDDLPPDALYRIVEGTDYGWPNCHSGVPDPDLGFGGGCSGTVLPEVAIQAHSAPLGLTFYDAVQFPDAYQGGLFMAYHGSWNRSEPTGYKVVFVPFEDGAPAGPPTEFATGWLTPANDVTGRPVGVTVGADGALYVSDDYGGFIYRISYQGP